MENQNKINVKNRKRNRLKGYDYSKDNLYFVTSCVKNMMCCFGDVVAVGTGRDLSVPHPNQNYPNQNYSNQKYPNQNNSHQSHPNENEVEMILNEFGIIANNQFKWLENQYVFINLHSYIVMPNHIHAVIEIDSILLKENIKIKSLSQIIGAYKTTSSKLIHEAGYEAFSWHRSFHDHIIKDEKSYLNIMNYIENNPKNWYKDSFYKK